MSYSLAVYSAAQLSLHELPHAYPYHEKVSARVHFTLHQTVYTGYADRLTVLVLSRSLERGWVGALAAM